MSRPGIRPLLAGWLMLAVLGASAPIAFAQGQSEPSFLHGVGRVLGGVVFEIPKTVLDATMSGPPVVGTMIGLLAAPAKAVQAIFGGLQEMAVAFDPWEIKRDAKNRGTLY